MTSQALDISRFTARREDSLGEEERANRKRLTVKTWSDGRAYARKLGTDEAEQHGALTRWYSERRFRGGRTTRKPPTWTHDKGPPPEWLLGHALRDSQSRIDARSMREVRHLVADVDVHGEPKANDDELRAAFFAPTTRKAKNAEKRTARAWRLERALPVLERLRAAIEPFGSSAFIETSPRGWHVVVLLAEAVDAREAASLGSGLASLAGELPPDVGVEAFPKLRADGKADHCRLPLCGPNKRVGPDFVSGGGTRAEALAELLDAPGVLLAEARAAFGSVALTSTTTTSTTTSQHVLSDATSAADGRLRGPAFVLEVLRLLTDGMNTGESRSAMQRVTAACCYVGLDASDTEAAMRAWIELPIHRARHAQTRSGRTELLAQVRAQLRHFERGTHSPRTRKCTRGELRSVELRAELARLVALGRERRHKLTTEGTAACATKTTTTPPTSSRARTAATAKGSDAARARSGRKTSPASSYPTSGSSSRADDTARASDAADATRRSCFSRETSRTASSSSCSPLRRSSDLVAYVAELLDADVTTTDKRHEDGKRGNAAEVSCEGTSPALHAGPAAPPPCPTGEPSRGASGHALVRLPQESPRFPRKASAADASSADGTSATEARR